MTGLRANFMENQKIDTDSPTDSPTESWSKRARFLTQLLVLSGTLNVALLATFSFFLLKERKKAVALPPISVQETPVEIPSGTLTNAEVLRGYCEKSYPELLSQLEDRQLV